MKPLPDLITCVKLANDPANGYDGDVLEYILFHVTYAKSGYRAATRRWAKELIKEIWELSKD